MNKLLKLHWLKRQQLRAHIAVLACAVLACAVLSSSVAYAADGAQGSGGVDGRQDMQAVRDAVRQFLLREATGLPGTVTVEVGALDNRLNLANCQALDTYLPPGSRLWGRVNVGVRCTAPARWQISVPSQVRVSGNYYVTSRPVMSGQTIMESDIAAVEGDLTAMSSNVVTDPAQALGHMSNMSLGAGIALRQDSLRLQQVVVQGQTVRLTSNGSGFRVSTDAQALNSASEGQLVKVKTANGQVISGTAHAGGVVIVSD